MIAVIICEYNPLHNGHIYHIQQTRKFMSNISGGDRDYIIAIMSGNFTQRGEIAILNKYTRAKLALENGVDMVIELPSIYATSSAELFAKGAIEIISNIQNIDFISFGSESGDINKIKNIAKLHKSNKYNLILKNYINQGNSYLISANMAMTDLGFNEYDSINTPNDVLGIEYYKQAENYGLNEKLICFKRLGSGYNDITISNNYSSASAIRQAIATNTLNSLISNVPENVYNEIIESKVDYEKLFAIIAYTSLSATKIYEDSEGIINRIKKYAGTTNNYSDFINSTHTKRYTKSKIRRVALHLCLKHTAEMTQLNNIKVLGVRQDSTQLLSLINKTCTSDIILENDVFANHVYNIVSSNKITLDKMLIV